jgi:phosphotransferase system IIB component
MSSARTKNILYRTGVITSFGILYWVSKHRAKRLSKTVNTELSSSEKVGFSVDSLIRALGTRKNIKDITSTLSSVSFIVDDINKIDEKEFRKNGVQGVLKHANKLTLIFGDNAPAIKKVIKDATNVSDLLSDAGDRIDEIKDKLVK